MDNPYSAARTRRSLTDIAAFKVLSQLATVGGFIVLARVMSQAEFGVYSLLYSIIAVIGTVLSLGLEQVLQRYQPEYLRAGNQAAAAWLLRIVASGRLAANLLLLAIVILAWDLLAPLVKLSGYRPLFLIFCLLIILHFQARILQLSLGAQMLHRYSAGSISLLAFLKLASFGLLAWLGQLTLRNAVLFDTAAYAAVYLFLSVVHRRHCPTAPAAAAYRPPPEERKRMQRYGLLSNFNDAGVLLLYSNLDNFFLAAYLDTVSVGIYSAFSRLRQMVVNTLPVKQFESVVQPLLFSIPAERAGIALPRYFSLLLNLNLLLQWPVFAFSAVYHHEITDLLIGHRYVDHSWLLPTMLGFAAVNAFADPAAYVAQYRERAGVMLLSKLFVFYNIAAMALLVPVIGIAGAAWAAGTAQTLKNAFIWWHVRAHARWLNAGPALLSAAAVWGTAIVAGRGLRAVLPQGPVLQLAAGALLFAAAGWAWVRSPALSDDDRQTLGNVSGARLGRLMEKAGVLRRTRGGFPTGSR
jgi:O-antigen/teichoic acid export membrane protein